ncbi:DUF202 domain-containing protein [Rothia terrae]|uniref:DUF202 domain-containing protein n=1 Tax=Rothia terrae TaxID=396015 RepID=A0A7H2BEF9_9MICC|nr:DUF202 domain-containing protein [Rothia terrae]NKZ34210.1 DUF202 domain-containing protein [Rothia terrae]QNV38055.1 DUF202 domain-containing protein [Rothia terrae]
MSKNHRNRLTRVFFPHGTEPDPRFTLANERTFLAWIRTALAFLAGGLAAYAFADSSGADASIWRAVSVLMPAAAAALALLAIVRWVRVERAIRNSRPLPAPLAAPLLIFVIFAVAAVAISLDVL